jgi:hypothetical protein
MKQLHIESIETPEEAMAPLMEQYILLLGMHDWSYQYSDDREMRIAGAEHAERIRDLANIVDPEFNIYWSYSPFARPASEAK